MTRATLATMVGKAGRELVSTEEAEAFKRRLRTALGLAEGELLSAGRAAELAGVAGVTPQAIRAAVEGKTKSLSAKSNALLARHLEVDPDWLALGDVPMKSGRMWPFGEEVTPEDFFSLRPEERRPAVDVLLGAIARQRLGGDQSPKIINART